MNSFFYKYLNLKLNIEVNLLNHVKRMKVIQIYFALD